MTETQASLSAWATETFGDASSHFRIAARANEEMAEVLRALSADRMSGAAVEAADVAIILYRLAEREKIEIDLMIGSNNHAHLYAHHELRGDAYSIDVVATRANVAMAMLLHRVARGDPDRSYLIGCDAADVVSLLRILCERLGTTLDAEIDAKMAINRKRVWNKDGTGHGYHVRDKSLDQHAERRNEAGD